jgi:hypothetical protein
MYGATELHSQFLKEFYLEEFEDATPPHESRIKRSGTRRSKILAYLTQNPVAGPNPSPGVAAMQVVHERPDGRNPSSALLMDRVRYVCARRIIHCDQF